MEDLGHAVEEPLLHHIPVRGIAIAAPDGHYPLPVWILLLRLQPRIPQAIEPGVTTPNGNLRTLSSSQKTSFPRINSHGLSDFPVPLLP